MQNNALSPFSWWFHHHQKLQAFIPPLWVRDREGLWPRWATARSRVWGRGIVSRQRGTPQSLELDVSCNRQPAWRMDKRRWRVAPAPRVSQQMRVTVNDLLWLSRMPHYIRTSHFNLRKVDDLKILAFSDLIWDSLYVVIHFSPPASEQQVTS